MKKDKLIKLYRSYSFYHIYNRGNNKALIFLSEKDYKLFKGLMYKYAKTNNLIVVAYCFMPNHFHLVLKMKDDLESVSKCMRAFMTSYVMLFNRKYQRVGHLWQGPFQARRITDKKDLSSVLVYIKRNPAEAGLTLSETDLKYRWLFIKKAFDCTEGLT
ncbi:transposase [Patescibacteria group bacterium]|nr:transposase [Patescibacteria group bacterium]